MTEAITNNFASIDAPRADLYGLCAARVKAHLRALHRAG